MSESIRELARELKITQPNNLTVSANNLASRGLIVFLDEPSATLLDRRLSQADAETLKLHVQIRSISYTRSLTGNVYLITCGTYHKIGKTIHLSKRLRELQSANGHELTLVGSINCKHYSKLELDLHTKYKAQRIRGEWFTLSEQDVRDTLSLMKTHKEIHNEV
jgi:hypothetical protein